MSAVEDAGFGERFAIESSASDGSRTIKVTGELDSGTCDALVEAFERAVADEDQAPLSLDLSDVAFIDSSGMRSMIQIERAAQDREIPLVLIPPPEDDTDLLRTVGISDRIKLASGALPTGDGVEVEGAGPLGAEFLDRVDIELPREPMAPSRARTEIREALAGRLDDAEIATVVLLTSELVTNAVIHPEAAEGSTLELRIWVYRDGVKVEVEDPGKGFDPADRSSSSRHGGRGLFLVDRCSASWGARRAEDERGRRFCVWFEFMSGASEPAAASG